MELREAVIQEINRRIDVLRTKQHSDGAWRFCFEGAMLTDCFMIMMLRAFEIEEETLISQIVRRIIQRQDESGAWKLYQDEREGNLSATIQAYVALLFSGHYMKEDPNMKKAEIFIKKNGGIANAHFMTKYMLALHGQYPYPKFFHIPMPLFLLPTYSPINIYEFSSYARIHLTPMIICINKRFTIKSNRIPDVSHLHNQDDDDWFLTQRSSLVDVFIQEGKKLASYPALLHEKGYKAAEKFMLDRIEKNGTLYSYASATFYMIYALLALGYEKTAPIIQQAIAGMKTYAWQTDQGIHIQNSPSTIWDTALLSYALQEAGISFADPMIEVANYYLRKKQQNKYGDWAVHAPNTKPGGWGFSPANTRIPDNDDTTAALRALTRATVLQTNLQHSWRKGVQWVLDMQNNDGGWGAFEKNANQKLLTFLPIENAEDAIIDASSADLTGRVLEFLGNYANMQQHELHVKKGIEWLLHSQEQDGSWYGKWGVCYIYGTWAAITGLCAAQIPQNHEQVQKAVRWLESVQHEDGGWGESCRSSEVKRFVPLRWSTPSQTAWALDALIAVSKTETPAIRKGIQFLLQKKFVKASTQYPTGIGLPGGFYIYYHSYNELFPLLALAHYRKKYDK
ncbi:squalene--hopene cyclase [Microbacteriaceae bacterium 4G12]